jgi:fatty-acyl-CoA synthase
MLVTGIKDLKDVREIEKVPLGDRSLPPSTYRMLEEGAAVDPDRVALRFFLRGDAYERGFSYTYRDLLGLINRTANMLDGLGVGDETVVSVVLPNLPETHFAIWGGKARGIAPCPAVAGEARG